MTDHRAGTRPTVLQPFLAGCLCTRMLPMIAGLTLFGLGAINRPANGQMPWRIVDSLAVGRDLELTERSAVRLAPDGSLFVLNFEVSQVIKIDYMGKVLWRAGRKGEGPGEFAQVYRLAARRNGGAIVYDMGRFSLTYFSPTGKYEYRKDLSLRFAQFDDIVELESGDIAICGVVSESARLHPARTAGVHVFSQDMSLVRSFGPLPATRDSAGRALRFWGAGNVAVSGDQTLWYTRRLPYELYQYSREGTLLKRIDVAPTVGGPDDFFTVQPTNVGGRSGFKYGTTGKDVPRPIPARELTAGILVTGLYTRAGSTVDVIDTKEGRRVASFGMPADWSQIIGYDKQRSYLWVVVSRDGEPVLLRLTIAV